MRLSFIHPGKTTRMAACSLLFAALLLLTAGRALCLEKLTDSEIGEITAKSGLSVGVSHTTFYSKKDSLRFTAVDNQDMFGRPGPENAYLGLEDLFLLAGVDGARASVDVGVYHAPAETYRVYDVAKHISDEYRWLEPGRLLATFGSLSEVPVYWEEDPDNPMPRPLEGRVAVTQAQLTNLFTDFQLDASLGFVGGRDLGQLAIDGIHMPPFTRSNGQSMPGAALTVYPGPGSAINSELRIRLSVSRFGISRSSQSSRDFSVSGLHLGEAFSSELPSHTDGTGSGPGIDTSGWGEDFTEKMYSGYFLFGNLNQVDFTDYIKAPEGILWYSNGRQLYHQWAWSDEIRQRYPDNRDVGLVANPISINFSGGGEPPLIPDQGRIILSTGLHGSIRVASVSGHGSDMGPIALDGIRVKHFELSFPGGHKREFYKPPAQGGQYLGTYDKGRIPPQQIEYMNNLEPGSWKAD